jgi:hypothetical protein
VQSNTLYQRIIYVKNLPIVSKFLTILGVLVIAVAFYATSQITFINSEYTHLKNGPLQATRDITAATSDLNVIRADIAQIMIDNTVAADQADLADISDYKNRFANFMDRAAGDDPINARISRRSKRRTSSTEIAPNLFS